MTDTSLVSGVKLLDGGPADNAKFIKVIVEDSTVTYTPYDLAGYRLKDGRVFQSFSVESNGSPGRFFLERIFKGRHALYQLQDEKNELFFFRENDSSQLQVVPNDPAAYAKFFGSYVKNCPKSTSKLKHLRLTVNSLVRFFRDNENCSHHHLPRRRYGLIAGISLNEFVPQQKTGLLHSLVFQYHRGYFAGLFVDSPLGVSNYTLSVGATVHHFTGSATFEDANAFIYDLATNELRLDVPLLVKYSFYKGRTIPFIEGGLVYSRVINSETLFFRYEEKNNDIFIEVDEPWFITGHQAGMSFAAGAVFKYSSKYSCQIKAGYSRLYSVEKRTDTLLVNELLFSLGLLF